MNVIETASREEILQFKLACKSEEFSDEEIWNILINFELRHEHEMLELVDILKQYAPRIFLRLNDSVK